MITAIDHVVIAVRDMGAALADYEALLEAKPLWRVTRDGVETALIMSGNVGVELMAPVGEGETATRLRAAMEQSGEGPKSLVFATDDINAMRHRAGRVGLEPEPIAARESVDAGAWLVFRANTEQTRGVRLFFIQREIQLPREAPVALDHAVIRSADFDGAAALYGARLGLDMRLDRVVAGHRFMFFRVGDVILEFVEDKTQSADLLWGLSWRVVDLDAKRAALAAAGVTVSAIRPGMKPGTRVFSVRDCTCGVPTLMIGSA